MVIAFAVAGVVMPAQAEDEFKVGLLIPGSATEGGWNGIAYDAAQKRLFVTGKWWPKLFEIELIPRDN